MLFRRRRCFFLLALFALPACEDPTGLVPGCDALQGSGIVLTPVDSISGDTIRNTPVTIVVRSGSSTQTTTETLQGSGGSIVPDSQRIGLFEVQVTASGYRLWIRRNVAVRGTVCGLDTYLITARLQRV